MSLKGNQSFQMLLKAGAEMATLSGSKALQCYFPQLFLMSGYMAVPNNLLVHWVASLKLIFFS